MADNWLKRLRRSRKEAKQRLRLSSIIQQIDKAIERNKDPIPVIVISYNNGIYVQNTINQLNAFDIIPIIIDNGSGDEHTIHLLSQLEQSCSSYVVRCNNNYGHAVGFIKEIYDCLPEIFAYTDPDLEFSPALPRNFREVLAGLTVKYCVYKAGFALDLDADSELVDNFYSPRHHLIYPNSKRFSIREWENQFWQMKLKSDTLDIYCAKIDTTFAVYNKNNFRGDFFNAVRVAGDYTAIHLPWFPKLDIMSETEKKRYLNNNKSTSWVQT